MPAQAQQETWTVGRLLNWTTEFLKQHGSETPRLDAEVLLAAARGCPRIHLYTEFDRAIEEPARAEFRKLVRKRAEGAPVAYLVGRKEFFSLEFHVTPDVLIPRPDTEFVVMEALALMRAMPGPSVLDVGTGSGAIAVAVAKNHTGARLTATDVNPKALEIARENAERHGVADRIRFLEGDLLEAVCGEQFALILSNPPYVATGDLERLPAGVRDYEPRAALDGGPDGLAVVRRIVAQAPDHVEPGGQLILEIGAAQERPVRELIEQRGGFELAPTVRDYAGHPRVVRAKRVA